MTAFYRAGNEAMTYRRRRSAIEPFSAGLASVKGLWKSLRIIIASTGGRNDH
jgi:hypothetical protein